MLRPSGCSSPTSTPAAGRGLTRRELLNRMVLRSKGRAAARFLSAGSSAAAPVVPGKPAKNDPDTEYLVSFAIGTPPQPVQLTLDTGSDLTWTQCLPCPSCYDQALPYFDRSRSSTLSPLPCASPACQELPLPSCGAGGWGNQTCVYTYPYGDRSATTGVLAADTFTFTGGAAGSEVAPGLPFGCGLFNHNTGNGTTANQTGTGIAGFGRGALSLPSQLKVDNFSYCFTTITESKPSPELLGLPPSRLYSAARGTIKTTPLIQNAAHPTFYYISLKGITVGSKRLPVPASAFALQKNGTGGTVIDSGTSLTLLPPQVYRHVRDAFVSHVKLPLASDDDGSPICFAVPHRRKLHVPKLVLHFEGATLDLPRKNYVFDEIDDEEGRSNTCIAVFPGGDMTTVIGNFQQQNMHILYDLAGNKLSFVPAHCDRV